MATMAEFKKLTVAKLKEELASRSLDVTGTKQVRQTAPAVAGSLCAGAAPDLTTRLSQVLLDRLEAALQAAPEAEPAGAANPQEPAPAAPAPAAPEPPAAPAATQVCAHGGGGQSWAIPNVARPCGPVRLRLPPLRPRRPPLWRPLRTPRRSGRCVTRAAPKGPALLLILNCSFRFPGALRHSSRP